MWRCTKPRVSLSAAALPAVTSAVTQTVVASFVSGLAEPIHSQTLDPQQVNLLAIDSEPNIISQKIAYYWLLNVKLTVSLTPSDRQGLSKYAILLHCIQKKAVCLFLYTVVYCKYSFIFIRLHLAIYYIHQLTVGPKYLQFQYLRTGDKYFLIWCFNNTNL